MKSDYQEIEDIKDLLIHLLSISLFYGDYAIPFHINNPNSIVSMSLRKKDIAALRKFASRNWLDFSILTEQKRSQLEATYQRVQQEYSEKIDTDNPRLPEDFMIELGERALSMEKFRDAHSAFQDAQKLDQRVNQLSSEAIRILQSREIKSHDANNETIEEKSQQVAELIYQAVKLKNPFGNQFQKLGYDLHYTDTESLRKFNKYIEQNLFNEIINFSIRFLIDDKTIAEKIIQHLGSGKVRRQVLKYLAIKFSGGKEKYRDFCKRFAEASELAKTASTEQDFMKIQKTLLGRGTGDNEYYQFLRELSLEHPVSALLLRTIQTQEGTKFVVPQILKSGQNLMEFLDLGI